MTLERHTVVGANTTQRRNNLYLILERVHTVALDPLPLGKPSVCVVFSPRL